MVSLTTNGVVDLEQPVPVCYPVTFFCCCFFVVVFNLVFY